MAQQFSCYQMDNSFSSDFEYKSAAISVSSLSHSQEMFFHSVPTSPGSAKLSTPSGFQTEPTSPRSAYEGANSNIDEFEFETSRRFSDFSIETNQREENQQKQSYQRQKGESLPIMAFADELFSNGKVIPLIIPPLKLPPRLQNGDGNKMSGQSSTASSPRSPGSLFSFQSFWNDDIDPFMVALEKVKWEKRGKSQGKQGLRRTRSLSPFRGYGPNMSNEKEGLLTPKQHPDDKKESRSPKMPPEPKGLLYARYVRLVRMGTNRLNELNETKTSNSIMGANNKEGEKRGFCRMTRKREKIMKFLFGNTYMGKDSANYMVKDEKVALGKPTLLRKLSFKFGESTQRDKYNGMAEMTKMTMVCYKPRLFLCLGYGRKCVK